MPDEVEAAGEIAEIGDQRIGPAPRQSRDQVGFAGLVLSENADAHRSLHSGGELVGGGRELPELPQERGLLLAHLAFIVVKPFDRLNGGRARFAAAISEFSVRRIHRTLLVFLDIALLDANRALSVQ